MNPPCSIAPSSPLPFRNFRVRQTITFKSFHPLINFINQIVMVIPTSMDIYQLILYFFIDVRISYHFKILMNDFCLVLSVRVSAFSKETSNVSVNVHLMLNSALSVPRDKVALDVCAQVHSIFWNTIFSF